MLGPVIAHTCYNSKELSERRIKMNDFKGEFNKWYCINEGYPKVQVMNFGVFGILRTEIRSNLGISESLIQIDHQSTVMLINKKLSKKLT